MISPVLNVILLIKTIQCAYEFRLPRFSLVFTTISFGENEGGRLITPWSINFFERF